MNGDVLADRIFVAADVLLSRRNDRSWRDRGVAAELLVDRKGKQDLELFATDTSFSDAASSGASDLIASLPF